MNAVLPGDLSQQPEPERERGVPAGTETLDFFCSVGSFVILFFYFLLFFLKAFVYLKMCLEKT